MAHFSCSLIKTPNHFHARRVQSGRWSCPSLNLGSTTDFVPSSQACPKSFRSWLIIFSCGTGRVQRHSVFVIGVSLLNQTLVFVPVMLFMILGNLNSRSLVTGSFSEGKRCLDCSSGTCSTACWASETSGGTLWYFLLTPIQSDCLKIASASTIIVGCMRLHARGRIVMDGDR